MSFFEVLFSAQQVERMGWALLHFLWQGAVAAWLLEIALTCLRNHSSQSRYLAGCIIMGAMACLPLATLSVVDISEPSAIDVPGISVTNSNSATATQRVAERTPIAALAPATWDRGHHYPGHGEQSAADQVGITEPQAASPGLTISITDPASLFRPLLPWLVAAWIMGVISLSVRLLAGWLQAQRLKRVGTTEMSMDWELRFLELCQRLAIQKPVDLAMSAMAAVPMTVGWMRPIVLVPASAVTGLSAKQLEAILAHELAHIRRHDYLVNLVQCVIETLLFYHPAIWWVSRRIRAERENCCDDLAVMACGDALMYAKALTRLEEMRWPTPRLAVAATGGQLLSRIQRLLGVKVAQQPVASRWMAGGMALGIGVFVWLIAGLALKPALAEQPQVFGLPKVPSLAGNKPKLDGISKWSAKAAVPPPTSNSVTEAKIEGLRYGWKKGQSYIYAIDVDIEGENVSEILKGRSSYHVIDVTADGATLNHSGHLMSVPRMQPGRPSSFSSMGGFNPWRMRQGPIGMNRDELRVTSEGRITRSSGVDSHLPWMLGSLSDLVIEPLSPSQASSWQVEHDCVIEESDGDEFPRSAFRPSATVRRPADEISRYKVMGGVQGLVDIEKQYELKTHELADGEPQLEMKGSGALRFDTALGVPRSLTFKATLFVRSAHSVDKLPMTISYRLLEGEELKQTEATAKPAEKKALTAGERTALIADLKSPEANKRWPACVQLSFAKPDEDRTPVEQALLPLLEDSDSTVRQHAAGALAVWGSATAVPGLGKLLDDKYVHVRNAAMRSLAAIGKPSEAAIRGLLQDNEWDTRVRACQILTDIGGPNSISALEPLLTDENPAVKSAAGRALEAIKNAKQPAEE